ncbi:DUF427 domain-containing protein [Mesorhizobium sp. BAC0120]|uniref:DUF427 domain-containing protein n=1 Tax=Mesorhizobium sp. BAC0120 TaxID=3090670 RepID=UPI00298BE49C|nr:DUF427 domain-containing protein [Mesorhizobium sp. BAC0120]MDW6023615.1 DUF427 domain-containing protein [Mesorhizobium sp. BAC0120]
MNVQNETTRSPRSEIEIEPYDGTVTVTFSSAIVASTKRAKIVQEAGHEPVLYIPFDDIYFEFLHKTDRSSRCPVKGTASYWRVSAVGETADDFMWAYETPNPAAQSIARHGAFDPDKAVIEAVPSDSPREKDRLG